MTKLPKKLQPFIHEETLPREDALTLLLFSANALMHMEGANIIEMTFGYSATLTEWYGEGFEGIESSDELFAVSLNFKDFLKLSQFATELALKMEAVNAKS